MRDDGLGPIRGLLWTIAIELFVIALIAVCVWRCR